MSIWKQWKELRLSLRAATSAVLAAVIGVVLSLAGVIPWSLWTFVTSTLTVAIIFGVYSAFMPRMDVIPSNRDEH